MVAQGGAAITPDGTARLELRIARSRHLLTARARPQAGCRTVAQMHAGIICLIIVLVSPAHADLLE